MIWDTFVGDLILFKTLSFLAFLLFSIILSTFWNFKPGNIRIDLIYLSHGLNFVEAIIKVFFQEWCKYHLWTNRITYYKQTKKPITNVRWYALNLAKSDAKQRKYFCQKWMALVWNHFHLFLNICWINKSKWNVLHILKLICIIMEYFLLIVLET